MSEPEHDVPPAGENVHLPGPSMIPLLTAVGITLTLIGITTLIELTALGLLITLVCVLRWVRDTRRDIDELPLDHH